MRRTYRVTGEHAVDGHQPGTTFASDLPEKTEARWIRQGRIAIVTSPEAPARSATRQDWDAYARTVGLDPDGFTNKDDLIAAISGDNDEGSD
jgi:hypothetical protein